MADLKPIYRGGEKARLAWLLAKGAKQSAPGGDTTDIDREIDRIREAGQRRAREAWEEEQAAKKAAARELAAAKAERKHLATKKRAAAIRARNAAKVQKAADRATDSGWW